MSADSLTPFAFEAMPVRGALVRLRGAWERLQGTLADSEILTDTLGQAAAATSLIAQSLKFDGAVTLQIQGAKNMQMLVMQCTHELDLRGVAMLSDDADPKTFAELTEGAHCAITVDAGERPYQGIVAIQETSLAASFEHYFARSVQVPSHLSLLATADTAAGLLLQQMPGEAIDADDWNRLGFLVATLSARDFEDGDNIALLQKLFGEDDLRVFGERSPRFHCHCSGRKVEDVLRMLGEKESREILAEQGSIDVLCEYCGRERKYDTVDVERVFQPNAVSGPESVQ